VPAERRARRRESWRVYRLQLALGGAGLAACCLVLAAGASSVHVRPHAANRLDVAGLRLTYPAVNAAAMVLLALAALGGAVLLVTLRAAWRQVRAHRRMLRVLPVARPLTDHPAVLVVDSPVPLAFCAGWLRPRVYVSAGVLERLSDRELRAVLAHEQQHGAVRDPLRLAVSRVLCQALFFLPVLGSLHATYADAAELTADAAALEALDGAAAPLASAMLAVGATEAGDVTGISAERVDALLGRPVARRLPRLLLIAALVTIAMLVALVWRASRSASVQATLNLPVASSQPCILVLALLPVAACLVAAVLRRPAPTAAPLLPARA
jgi:beta-lactamase regulating signal transducer with metallopeptidase domain